LAKFSIGLLYSNYSGVIISDYEKRNSDMFIVIISDWIKEDGITKANIP